VEKGRTMHGTPERKKKEKETEICGGTSIFYRISE